MWILYHIAIVLITSVCSRVLADEPRVFCYFSSWATYRKGYGKFDVDDIDPFLCTHVVYAFTGLDPKTNKIKPLDPYNDLEENWGKGSFLKFTNLTLKNEALKVIIGIGGWNEGSAKYSKMASVKESRQSFITSCVELIKRYNFSGLDLDWEYPGNREGSKPEDKKNFVKLLSETKAEFSKYGYLLTGAVSAGQSTIDTAYNIPEISRYFDIINIMTYDYHGSGWESFTGHNTPLYSGPQDDGHDVKLNVNYSINYWLSHGAPKDKLTLGLAFYGQSYTLANKSNHEFYSPISGKGQKGIHTRLPGYLGYNEICEKLDISEKDKWTVYRDKHYRAPYMVSGNQFVSYDDAESISEKVAFAKAHGLSGVMVWSIETDDFHGRCHYGVKNPLLTTINQRLGRRIRKPKFRA